MERSAGGDSVCARKHFAFVGVERKRRRHRAAAVIHQSQEPVRIDSYAVVHRLGTVIDDGNEVLIVALHVGYSSTKRRDCARASQTIGN